MSAYLHNEKHISAVVAAVDLLRHARMSWARVDARFEHLCFPREILAEALPVVADVCIDGLDARGSFYALAVANAQSVDYRYPSDKGRNLEIVKTYQPEPFSWPKTPASLLAAYRAAVSLEYQSCEVPNWKDTAAAQWLERLKKALIEAHPDYVTAAWTVE